MKNPHPSHRRAPRDKTWLQEYGWLIFAFVALAGYTVWAAHEWAL